MTLRTFVLVPGAWHGGWVWNPVAKRIRAAGHHAIPVTLPGLDGHGDPATFRLADAIDHLVDGIVTRDLRNVTLVAHSWGGYPATGAAHRVSDRVSKVIYVNALVPAPGTSLADDNPPEAAKAVRETVAGSPGFAVPLPSDLVRKLLMQDASDETQDLVADLIVPQPGHYLLDPLDVPSVRVPGIPTAYILSDDDRGIPRPGEEYAERLNVKPIRVPGGHNAMLTFPDDLTRALLLA